MYVINLHYVVMGGLIILSQLYLHCNNLNYVYDAA